MAAAAHLHSQRRTPFAAAATSTTTTRRHQQQPLRRRPIAVCRAADRTRDAARLAGEAIEPQQQQQTAVAPRRAVLLLGAAAAAASTLLLPPRPGAAAAAAADAPAAPATSSNPLEGLARQVVRPAGVTPRDAAVALLDARATLRDMAPLVASAPDSRERFEGRRLWPAYAKWLRPVGPSAPVAAALIAGDPADVDATLSAEYGGTAGGSGSGAGAVDAVYVALGRVLTISGRTIRDEAQVQPELIKEAERAIDAVVQQLPASLVDEAQQFRAARAAGGGKQ